MTTPTMSRTKVNATPKDILRTDTPAGHDIGMFIPEIIFTNPSTQFQQKNDTCSSSEVSEGSNGRATNSSTNLPLLSYSSSSLSTNGRSAADDVEESCNDLCASTAQMLRADFSGLTPQSHGNVSLLTRAVSEGDLHTVRSLLFALPHTLINVSDERGFTFLHFAVSAPCGADEQITRYLSRSSGLRDRPDDMGATPLMHAVKMGKLNVVKTLLRANADTDVRDHHGQTALMHACMRDDLVVADALLTGGADVSCQDHFGRSAFLWCCVTASHQVLKRILPGILSLEETEATTCDTCLHLAAREGHFDVVKILLHVQPAICMMLLTATNVFGQSAEDVALEHCHCDIAWHLSSARKRLTAQFVSGRVILTGRQSRTGQKSKGISLSSLRASSALTYQHLLSQDHKTRKPKTLLSSKSRPSLRIHHRNDYRMPLSSTNNDMASFNLSFRPDTNSSGCELGDCYNSSFIKLNQIDKPCASSWTHVPPPSSASSSSSSPSIFSLDLPFSKSTQIDCIAVAHSAAACTHSHHSSTESANQHSAGGNCCHGYINNNNLSSEIIKNNLDQTLPSQQQSQGAMALSTMACTPNITSNMSRAVYMRHNRQRRKVMSQLKEARVSQLQEEQQAAQAAVKALHNDLHVLSVLSNNEEKSRTSQNST